MGEKLCLSHALPSIWARERRELKTVQARYGLASLSDGIRLAIHVLASLLTEQGNVVEQFRPRRQKPAERVLGNETVAAQARRISEEAQKVSARALRNEAVAAQVRRISEEVRKVRATTEAFLTKAKAKKATA